MPLYRRLHSHRQRHSRGADAAMQSRRLPAGAVPWHGVRMNRAVWIIVAAGGTILTIGLGVRQSFGLFLAPMSVDLGFGRELFGLAMGIANLMWGLASPFAGAVADRFGVARTVLAGAVLYTLGVAWMANAGSGADVIGASALTGLGIAAAGFTTILGAVGRAAPPEKRSIALGIVAAGGSVGQFLIVPVGHALLTGYGWAGALWGLAIVSAAMIPLARGLAGAPTFAAQPGAQSAREALREAFRHRSFWLLTAGFFVCGFHVVFVATHLPAFLADRGLPGWVAAWSLAIVGIFNIIGTWIAGQLGQTKPKKSLLAALYALRSLVFLVFILAPLTPASTLAFAAGLGLLWLSTVPLTSGLVATFFGPTYMAMLYGIVFFSHQIGSFLGAWLGGVAYDVLGSYDAMWWISVALGLASAAIHLPIAERPVARLMVAGARA